MNEGVIDSEITNDAPPPPAPPAPPANTGVKPPPQKKKETLLPLNVGVRYLYQPGELEGGERRRATDPIWSLNVYRVGRSVVKPNEPILYYLYGGAGDPVPRRGFVREELLVVPPDTQLPPSNVLKKL